MYSLTWSLRFPKGKMRLKTWKFPAIPKANTHSKLDFSRESKGSPDKKGLNFRG